MASLAGCWLVALACAGWLAGDAGQARAMTMMKMGESARAGVLTTSGGEKAKGWRWLGGAGLGVWGVWAAGKAGWASNDGDGPAVRVGSEGEG